MSVAGAAPQSSPEGRYGVPLVAVGWLVVGAALVGVVFGGMFRSEPPPAVPPPPTTVAAAGVRLELPPGWVRGGAAALTGFDQPLWLRNARAHVQAAVELLPAASLTLVPAGVQASGAPAVVPLGQGKHAWRYEVLEPGGAPATLYAAPTTKGIATVGCLGGSGAAAERACSALVLALTVPGSRRLEPDPRAAFFSRLSATVATLDAARAKGLRALDAARRPTGQALAADDLARAHRAAAAELAPLTSSDDGLAIETAGSLGATASAYGLLANAARARSPKIYAAAGRIVSSAGGQLRRTMAKLATALDVASDPAAKTVNLSPARPAATPFVAADANGGSSAIDLSLLLLPLFAGVACLAGFWAVRKSSP